MTRGAPQLDEVKNGITSLKNFADSLIEFIDAPSVKAEELTTVNGRVTEFFKLIDEANTFDLSAQDTIQLQSIVESFHKTVTKKYQKIKGKVFMAEAGTTMAKVEERDTSSTRIAETAQKAVAIWKGLVRQEGKSTTVIQEEINSEGSMISAEINEKLKKITNTYSAILSKKMLIGLVYEIKMLCSTDCNNLIGGRIGLSRDNFVKTGKGDFGASSTIKERVDAFEALLSRKDIVEGVSHISKQASSMNERDIDVGRGIALVANKALDEHYISSAGVFRELPVSELKASEIALYIDMIIKGYGDLKPRDNLTKLTTESWKPETETIIIGALIMNEDVAKRFHNVTQEYVQMAQDPMIATAIYFALEKYLSYNTMSTGTAGKTVSVLIDTLSDKDVEKKIVEFYKNLNAQQSIEQNRFKEISDLIYESLYLIDSKELPWRKNENNLYQRTMLGKLDAEQGMLRNSAETFGYLKEISGRKNFDAPHLTLVPKRLLGSGGGEFHKDRYEIFLPIETYDQAVVLHEGYHGMFAIAHVDQSTILGSILGKLSNDLWFGIFLSINEGFAELLELTKAIKDEARWWSSAGEAQNPKELLEEKTFTRVRTYLKDVSENGNENEASSIAKDVYDMAKSSKSTEEFIGKLAAKIIPYGINGVPLENRSPQDPHEIGLILATFELVSQKYDDKAAIRRSLEKRPEEILGDIFELVQSDNKGRLIESISSSM